uniref:Uncharacterized protein n=1 Tax=Oryza glumipatula TaxID=40148 RepID=A0A0D9Y316_9ORYZ
MAWLLGSLVSNCNSNCPGNKSTLIPSNMCDLYQSRGENYTEISQISSYRFRYASTVSVDIGRSWRRTKVDVDENTSRPTLPEWKLIRSGIDNLPAPPTSSCIDKEDSTTLVKNRCKR